MGSGAQQIQLPVIHFSKSDLKPGTTEWDSVKSQVWEAISEYGCFKGSFDEIPPEYQKAFLGEVKGLFDLPRQTKTGYVSEIPFRGYNGQLPSSSLYEGLGIDDPHIIKTIENFSNVFWPEGNPSFSKTVQALSKQVTELEKIIRRMILESSNLDKYLDEHLNLTNYFMRMMRYGGPQTIEPVQGLRPHTDSNITTILFQSEVDGLEIQTKGGEWISVELSQDHSFVFIIGESFHVWSNGRLHSPCHRVSMVGNEARYSAAFFQAFKAGHMVKAPEEVVDEEHPLLFKPFDFLEFAKFFHTPIGRASGLKAYCSV